MENYYYLKIECMEQNHSYASGKAITELGYNPMSTREAFTKSIGEHVKNSAIPSKRAVRNFQFGFVTITVAVLSAVGIIVKRSVQ